MYVTKCCSNNEGIIVKLIIFQNNLGFSFKYSAENDLELLFVINLTEVAINGTVLSIQINQSRLEPC